jgi:predicted HicB family RNase H-like nuclease
MERVAIPAVPELNNFHTEVKQITAACTFQAAQVRNPRNFIVTK